MQATIVRFSRGGPAVMAIAVAIASFILPGNRASLAWAASDPCASSLSQCPSNGCAQKGTPDAFVNEQKRRIPAGGTATFLTFEQFAELQQAVDDKGIPQGRGSNLTKTGRKKLKNLSLDGGIEVGEGDLVELTGFIARKRKLDWAGAESVNCRLTDDADNDIHIPMVEDPNGSEYNSVVVEPIPQEREPEWTLKNLKRLQKQHKLLLIRGQLSYDNKHRVHDDPDDDGSLKREPKRFTLWEIHPVTEILVCKKAPSQCDPENHGDWEAVKNQ